MIFEIKFMKYYFVLFATSVAEWNRNILVEREPSHFGRAGASVADPGGFHHGSG
jgi:hypothetical protein